LVKWRENVVFDVTLADGRRVALRIHRPGYQTRGAVEAELDWTGRLAAAGVPVPAPVATLGGGMTAMSGDAVVSAVAWLPGVPIGAAERPLATTEAERARIMRDVGALIAGMHAATDALALPSGFERPRWDAEGLLGTAPLWGRFWENAAFTAADRALVQEARSVARGRLAAMAGADFGLIHADCLRENVLSDGGRMALIDFDDSGWGFRAYDLATALFQGLEEPGLDVAAGALVDGYRAARSFAGDAAEVLTLFLMLRSFASAGWITTRAGPGDARLPFYAARAVRLARAVLNGRAAWD
jgi:Ser/Thr protein kinase RdoA (MazF antagonist)